MNRGGKRLTLPAPVTKLFSAVIISLVIVFLPSAKVIAPLIVAFVTAAHGELTTRKPTPTDRTVNSPSRFGLATPKSA